MCVCVFWSLLRSFLVLESVLPDKSYEQLLVLCASL